MKTILFNILFLSTCSAKIANPIFNQESMSKIGEICQSSISSGIDKEKRTFDMVAYFFKDQVSKDAHESEKSMRKIILKKLQNHKKEKLQIIEIMTDPNLAITLISYQDQGKDVILTVIACPRHTYLTHGITYCELNKK